MKTEISAGAVIYRKENGQNLFLLLRYPAVCHRSGRDYWDYVKGHIESGESERETIMREAAEETGLSDLKLAEGFLQKMEYFFTFEGQKIFKIVNFRLAETFSQDIVLSDEHNDFAWLPFDEAYKALSFDNAKKVLAAANEFLHKSGQL
jgi:8-oxo-dGTP pyrophosphatase MutT (NUDIX family)